MQSIELTYTLDSIDSVVSAVLNALTSKTLLFYGDMGVGKTTLIKELAQQLGSDANVNSPTFSVVNEYETTDDLIYHFDLYRIKDEEEALNFGIDEYLDSGHWLFIEWPEKLGHLLPENYNSITMHLKEDGSRTLKLNPNTNLT